MSEPNPRPSSNEAPSSTTPAPNPASPAAVPSAAAAADEHLPTTRLGALLPPISPPPKGSRPPSSPPPSVPLAPAAVLGDDAPLEPNRGRSAPT
ncbi:MAG: hypothetical protein JOZ69_25040, partial [Myxococcales bacterium]|nr:hypothetical protein [Myxococcales bacterium]